MAQQKLNLEKILFSTKFKYDELTESDLKFLRGDNISFSVEEAQEAIRDGIKQALELAAENAETKSIGVYMDIPQGAKYNEMHTLVDKQSILDVNNLIE